MALALSGGGDSMALLEIAATWAKRAGRRLLAITVDHGLNPDSPAWSGFCEAAARSVGADWIERRWEGDKPATGLPNAARRARHGLIANASRDAGARVVLFAHTADDIAESDWMRARGSTLGRLREWAPSPVWPDGRGLMLLRPMLEEGRGALRGLLSAAGRGWIEDPANTAFGRGRARAALNPLLESEGLRPADHNDASSAERARGHAFTRVPPFAQERRQVVVRSSPLSLGEGYAVERSIGATELSAVLLCAAGRDTPPRGDRLETLTNRLKAGEDFTATLAGARIAAQDQTVLVGREPGDMRRRAIADIALAPRAPAVWDGRYEIIARDPGWTVTAALGRLNALSKADRAIVNTVPAWARAALPVLIRDGGTAPVLAWRQAEVFNLAPRRLSLAQWASSGETTQESELGGTIHGETPPPDLF